MLVSCIGEGCAGELHGGRLCWKVPTPRVGQTKSFSNVPFKAHICTGCSDYDAALL